MNALEFQGIHPPYGFEKFVHHKASRNSSASSASPIKTLYFINYLRDVERMLTWIPPVMMGLKLTISYMEVTLYSTVSFPYFFKPATNLMMSNLSPALAFGKLFNIKVLPALNTDIYFGFHFRLFLDPFLALALFCQSYQDHEQKRKQNRNVPLLICLNLDHIICHICHWHDL